jgi:inorganic pyrophosphatase/exopolyphosphatase
MSFELFNRVALRVDIPSHNLQKGDIATIVDHHPVKNGEDGYSLEVFNAVGETIAVMVVAESQIEPLSQNEVLRIRVLDEAV